MQFAWNHIPSRRFFSRKRPLLVTTLIHLAKHQPTNQSVSRSPIFEFGWAQMTGLLSASCKGLLRTSSPREQQPRLRETARQVEELMTSVTNRARATLIAHP